jgi:putative endopeptidase
MQRPDGTVPTALFLVLLFSGIAIAQVPTKPQTPSSIHPDERPAAATQPSRDPSGQLTAVEAPTRVPGIDLAALDRTVNACQDFYQFACGGWLKANSIPPSEPSWSRFNELAERNRQTLRSILEADAQPGTDRTPVQTKIGDYYAACMDEPAINQKGLAPLKPILDQIEGIADKRQLPALLADLHQRGIGAFFGVTSEQDFENASMVIAFAAQGGLGLPNRDYYLKDDAKSVEQRIEYVAHVANMLRLMGTPATDVVNDAATVMRIETELAKASLGPVQLRNPQNLNHKTTRAALASLTPNLNWDTYLNGVGIPHVSAVNVITPDFFKALDALISSTSLDDLKTYMRWHTVHGTASMLPTPFVDENFAFYGKVLSGSKELRPRWKRCVEAVDSDLGEALGQEYVERTFGKEGKERALTMVNAIEASLAQDIRTLPWMTDTTKQQALVKLKAIRNKIGYPDVWRDYSALRVDRSDALGNSLRANAFELHRQLAKVDKPVQRGEWGMTPPTVNAYYHPLLNEINFPAGILQPPFYNKAADDASNFGGIGSVIGHELTHGFDDSGRQFAANGDLKDWWTPQDAKEFVKRAGCIVDQYGSYNVTGDVKVNGKLTLGENTADNGGVRVAYMALMQVLSDAARAKPTDGFTPEQRFFIGWGQIWCENATPEFQRLKALTNPHSENKYRVIGVVSNMPEFAKAFGCKAGDAMVRDPVCRVW